MTLDELAKAYQTAPEAAQETIDERPHSAIAREQRLHREAAQRAREYANRQQTAIKETEARRTEILRSIRAGEPIEKVFLLAVDCISSATGDSVFKRQISEELFSVYGIGLLHPEPLKIELESVRKRIAMLSRRELEKEPEEDRKRIAAALKAHRAREEDLKKKIYNAQEVKKAQIA